MGRIVRRDRLATARDALVLAGAALLAVWTRCADFQRGWFKQYSLPASVDATLVDLRRELQPGDRIGVLVPSLDPSSETAFWYSAQYALAPALVYPVVFRECLQAAPGPRCEVGNLARVAVLEPDGATLAFLERRLGLIPAHRSGRVVLLVKGAR